MKRLVTFMIGLLSLSGAVNAQTFTPGVQEEIFYYDEDYSTVVGYFTISCDGSTSFNGQLSTRSQSYVYNCD